MKHRRAGAAAVVGLVDKYIYVFGEDENVHTTEDKKKITDILKIYIY